MKLHKFLRALSAFCLVIITQLACERLMPSSVSTTTPLPTQQVLVVTSLPTAPTNNAVETSMPGDNEIMAGIQQSLDLYAQAYNENKPDLLTQVVDQENKPFRRIVRNRFDDYQKSSDAGQYQYEYKVLDIEKREFGYVIAHFEWVGYQAEARWPFRLLGGTWVLTEPTVEQIGKPVTQETTHFTFTTYPWADDTNQKIMDMMETARENVKQVLGKVPEEGKAHVHIMPIYGLQPFDPMLAIAKYTGDGIDIYYPYSYAFDFYDPQLGWDGDLQQTLTHEYTHLVHAEIFHNAGRLASWMSEGLAEYVSGAKDNVSYACYEFKSGTLIPIMDEDATAVNKQDLMHMYTLKKDFGLSYNFATSLVYFTTEKYGGMDGFWKLANALDETGSLPKALQKAFGISYDEYNAKWQAWLKQQC